MQNKMWRGFINELQKLSAGKKPIIPAFHKLVTIPAAAVTGTGAYFGGRGIKAGEKEAEQEARRRRRMGY